MYVSPAILSDGVQLEFMHPFPHRSAAILLMNSEGNTYPNRIDVVSGSANTWVVRIAGTTCDVTHRHAENILLVISLFRRLNLEGRDRPTTRPHRMVWTLAFAE